MTTLIRPEISKKNRYWIDKHRHYELKHFCRQYPKWKKSCVDDINIPSSSKEKIPTGNIPGDPTAKNAIRKACCLEKIKLLERLAIETDKNLHNYILKAVTEGLSYTYLKCKLDIPCSKDTYYDRYRRFFWLLDKIKD